MKARSWDRDERKRAIQTVRAARSIVDAVAARVARPSAGYDAFQCSAVSSDFRTGCTSERLRKMRLYAIARSSISPSPSSNVVKEPEGGGQRHGHSDRAGDRRSRRSDAQPDAAGPRAGCAGRPDGAPGHAGHAGHDGDAAVAHARRVAKPQKK